MNRCLPLVLWFVLFFLLACAPAVPTSTPSPTMDVGAVQTKAALDVFATQTASVPTATPTPAATQTPLPTATTVPLPTATLPAGWTAYRAVTGKFSLAYPAAWTLRDQKPDSLILSDFAHSALIGIFLDAFKFTDNPTTDQDQYTEYVLKGETRSVLNLAKGVWHDGTHAQGVIVGYLQLNQATFSAAAIYVVGFPAGPASVQLRYSVPIPYDTKTVQVPDVLQLLSASVRVD